MIRLNLPSFDIKVSGSKQHPQILDVLRRKFITLTPEEWVRQHFVHFLIEHKGYPASLLANEIQLKCGDKVLRADSVLYSRELQPRMIIEYKAPHIPITQKVFDQISVQKWKKCSEPSMRRLSQRLVKNLDLLPLR